MSASSSSSLAAPSLPPPHTRSPSRSSFSVPPPHPDSASSPGLIPGHTRSRSKSYQEMDADRKEKGKATQRVRALEACSWVFSTLKQADPTLSASDDADARMSMFFDQLSSGVLLCQLINAIVGDEQGQTVKFRQPIKDSHAMSFVARDNVANFIQACKNVIGLKEDSVFVTDDLITRRNDVAVVNTLLLLAAAANDKYNVEQPQLLKLDRELDALEKESDARHQRQLQRQQQQPSTASAPVTVAGASGTDASAPASSTADATTVSATSSADDYENEDFDDYEEEFEQALGSHSRRPSLVLPLPPSPPTSVAAAAAAAPASSSSVSLLSSSSPSSSSSPGGSTSSSSSSSSASSSPIPSKRGSISVHAVGGRLALSKYTNLDDAIQACLKFAGLQHVKVTSIVIKNKKQQRSAAKKNAGQYRFGSGPKVFVRVVQNELMVRDSGNWEELVSHVRLHNR